MTSLNPLLPRFTTGPKIETTDKDEVDLTIIVAHRGHPMGLWMTIQSAETDLRDSGLSYNIVTVPNGYGDDELLDEKRVWHFLEQGGHNRATVKRPEPMSPPSARNLGAEVANGKYLFFFDNHCMVHPGYFKRAIGMMEMYGIEMLHSTTVFYEGEQRHYHYNLTLEKDFWGRAQFEAPQHVVPYKVAVAGHGGFVVKRKTWNELGGYWNGFVGYGGEEVYWDLGMWMRGREVWLDPQLIHYHFAGNRGYARHYTDEFFKNMLMCANILGGQKRMEDLANNFLGYSRKKSNKTMFELMAEARERSAHFAAQFEKWAVKSLDEQLSWFKANNIQH